MKVNPFECVKEYGTFNEEDKNIILDKIIDVSLKIIEDALMFNPEINRMDFLLNSLNETLAYQEQVENYEACSMIVDLIKRINAA